MVLIAVGCAKQTINTTSYATIKTAATVYYSVMEVAADMTVKGDMSDEQYTKLSTIADIYRKAGKLATVTSHTYITILDKKMSEDCTLDPSKDPELVDAKLAATTAVKTLWENYDILFTTIVDMGFLDKFPILKFVK
jgi:archaellin